MVKVGFVTGFCDNSNIHDIISNSAIKKFDVDVQTNPSCARLLPSTDDASEVERPPAVVPSAVRCFYLLVICRVQFIDSDLDSVIMALDLQMVTFAI